MYIIYLLQYFDSFTKIRHCCGDDCCASIHNITNNIYKSFQFWLWLTLVFITLLSFISFSFYYALRWRLRQHTGNINNPFLVAQLTTTG